MLSLKTCMFVSSEKPDIIKVIEYIKNKFPQIKTTGYDLNYLERRCPSYLISKINVTNIIKSQKKGKTHCNYL